MSETPNRAEGVLSEMAAIIKDELAAHGIASPGELAAACVGRLAKALGGCQFYLPKGAVLERHLRDLAICASHDGTHDGANGILSLAKRHNLSELTVYRILSKGKIPNAC